jgi:hypothetical protein
MTDAASCARVDWWVGRGLPAPALCSHPCSPHIPRMWVWSITVISSWLLRSRDWSSCPHIFGKWTEVVTLWPRMARYQAGDVLSIGRSRCLQSLTSNIFNDYGLTYNSKDMFITHEQTITRNKDLLIPGSLYYHGQKQGHYAPDGDPSMHHHVFSG